MESNKLAYVFTQIILCQLCNTLTPSLFQSNQALLKDIDNKLITITKGLYFHNRDISSINGDIINLYNLIEITEDNFFIDVSKYDQYLCLLYKKPSFDNQNKLLFNIINFINIFDVQGKLFSQIQIETTEDVVCCQFLNNTHIMIIKVNGYCNIYTISGVLLKQLKLIVDIQQQEQIIFATIGDDNIIAVCNDNSICYVENITKYLYNSKSARIVVHSITLAVDQKTTASTQSPKCQYKFIHAAMIPKGQYNHDSVMYQDILVAILRTIGNNENINKDIFVIMYLKDNITQSYYIEELVNNDSKNEIPNSLSIQTIKICQYQPSILLFDKANSQLMLLNLHQTFESEQPPVIEIVQPVCYQQQILFDFMHDLPCYFNDVTNTLSLILPTRSGNKIKEVFVQNVIYLRHNKRGVTSFTIGYQQQMKQEIQNEEDRQADIFQSRQRSLSKSEVNSSIWNENKQSYRIDQLQIASQLYVQVLTNEKIEETKLINSFLHYYKSENDLQVINICEGELQKVSNLNTAIVNLFDIMYDSTELQVAALLLQTIAFVKIYLPSEKQWEITQKFDAAKKLLRVAYDLNVNATNMPISIFQLKSALEDKKLMQEIIQIICSSGHYQNGVKIINFLSLDASYSQIIMLHKSIVHVLKNPQQSDDCIFKQIHQNIQQMPQIAKQLADYLTKIQERQKVVQMLIEKETNEDDQIQILLESQNYEQAIIKAYIACNEGMIIEALNMGFKNTSPEQLIKQLLQLNEQQKPSIKSLKSQSNIQNISNLIIQQIDVRNLFTGNNQNSQGQDDDKLQFRNYITNLLEHYVNSYAKYSIQLSNLSGATPIENNNNLIYISNVLHSKSGLLRFQLAKLKFNNQKISETAIFQLQEIQENSSCELGLQLYKYINQQAKIFSEYEELKTTYFENISLVSVLKSFGSASVSKLTRLTEKQNYQAKLQDFTSLTHLKQFISMFSKDISLTEAQIYQFVCYGIIEGLSNKLNDKMDIQKTARLMSSCSQLLHDFIAGLPKSIQKQIAGQVIQYMSRKVPNSQSNVGLQNLLISYADKREILKVGIFQQNAFLIKKVKDGYLENQLLGLSIQSISRDVQEKIMTQ